MKAELLVKATLAKNGLLVVRDLVLGQTRNGRLREITRYKASSDDWPALATTGRSWSRPLSRFRFDLARWRAPGSA